MRVLLCLLATLALTACASLSDRARDQLDQPGLEGTRWGLVVTTLDGRELIAINPDQRFLPGSNTKLFTVAAAFLTLGDMTQPDPGMGTSVRIAPNILGPPDLTLVGGGDATLLDAADCQRNCLADLADMVVANGINEVGAVIGDESRIPHEHTPPGWSHDDIITRSGAPVSALTVNSNEVIAVITPGTIPGDRATVDWQELPGLFVLLPEITTVASDAETDIRVERDPGSIIVRIHGQVRMGAQITLPVAIEDPATSAAMRFKALLAKRNVKVGKVMTERARVRLPDVAGFAKSTMPGVEIARLVPAPLIDNVTFLNKQSQNLHSELLLRRVGLATGDGSREAGLAVVETMLAGIAIPRWSWDLFDGSGMSVYNRVTPRTVATLLSWTTQQPWSDAFRATLPIGGVDGTVRRRFTGTSLEGRIFAKTGTLMGTTALSGFMLTKSGQTLIFSAFANERPSTAESAIAALDATLVTISEMN